ncbi:MAG: CsgG/HfaB family protein [Xanthomonadales bacterium]|nr:CsgG/HfaB family protein [Xanthomonadales bacterium]
MKRILIALLVFLSGSAVAADKPVLGVVEFKNESGAAWWGGGVGWELSGMLANELVATRSFRVVERSKLESVIQEQNLGASGRVSAGTGAQIGKITGADYVVMGTVTAFERDVADSGGGVSFGGFSVGGKKDEAYLAVDIRVVNTTTSEIEYVRTIEGRSKGGGIRLGVRRGGFGGSLANEEKTPTGKAIRAALVEVSNYLECVMVKQTNRCLDEYDAKEQRRRDSASDALDLDG